MDFLSLFYAAGCLMCAYFMYYIYQWSIRDKEGYVRKGVFSKPHMRLRTFKNWTIVIGFILAYLFFFIKFLISVVETYIV